jgi:hypothetical protein
MSLKELIKDQVIIIDDHKRGTGEIKDFDNTQNDVHIDKETNFPVEGKRQKLKIRIPINSDKPISIENKRRQVPIPNRLKREIRSAFENREVRNAFMRDVLETLSNYKSVLNSEQKVLSILERLSKHFDLQWDTEKLVKYKDEILLAYTQFYTDDNGRVFFIKLDRDKITIGEDSGFTKRFRNFGW